MTEEEGGYSKWRDEKQAEWQNKLAEDRAREGEEGKASYAKGQVRAKEYAQAKAVVLSK